MNKRFLSSNRMLVTLIILENLFLYYFYQKGLLTQGKNAWGLFLSSVLFGIVILYKFHKETIIEASRKYFAIKSIPYGLIMLAGGFLFLGIKYKGILDSIGIDPQNSDIVPLIIRMVTNFLSGQNPYAPVNFFGKWGTPTYLTMHWFPFVFASLFKIDYRWVPYGLWCIAALSLFTRVVLHHQNRVVNYLVAAIIILSFYIIIQFSPETIGATIELLIAAYYMLFILGLGQTNPYVQGLLISFCLLSRYSVVLWLPLYVFVLFVSGNRKLLVRSAATAFIVVVLLYVIPFLSKDWMLPFKNHDGYDVAALFEWGRHNYEGKPAQLFSGTGFAYFIYTRFSGLDMLSRIKILQKMHIILSLLSTLILGCWFWFNKRKIDYRIFLMGSFKIYFAVFLFLIQVPYVYLMCVGNFVSIAIFCEQLGYTLENKNS